MARQICWLTKAVSHKLAAMKIRNLRFGGVLFLALAHLSQLIAAEKATPPAATSTNLHSLWKLQGKNCSVYFLGSVHVLKEQDYPLPAPLEAAYSDSQIVAFETDVAALEDPKIAFQMLAKGRLPEGETLETQLSPAVYQAFTNRLKDSIMPMALFDQLTPAMAAMTLVVLEIQKLGFDPNFGVDKHFFPLAKEAGKV